jgi:hypothetical protein
MTAKTKLSNTQIELLKLFSTNMDETELAELRNILADFYAKKAIQTANKVWDEKKLTPEDMEKWLNEPS